MALSVRQDKGLNKIGMSDRLRQAAAQLGTQLAKVTADRKRKLQQDLEMARRVLPEQLPKPTPDKVPTMLLYSIHNEIRNVLRSMDPITRGLTLKLAADAGDVDTLLAVQEAPRITRGSLVDDATLKDSVNRYYKKHKPDEWGAFEAVEQALSYYDANAAHAATMISEACQGALVHTGFDVIEAKAAVSESIPV